MPVDDDVHILTGSIRNTLIDQGFQMSLIAICTVSTGFCCIHGQADDIHIPFLTKLMKSFLIDIVREPGKTVGADAF